MSNRCLDDLLSQMPAVIAHSENEWSRNFAKSVLRQAKRLDWQPSPKQRHVMERLVGELYLHADELAVIDEDDEWR